MWETVELREIRVFLAIADELHFGRAAERLGITQSRASQSLRELELKLGTTLVERSSRHVALTPAGDRFRREIEPLHEQLCEVLVRATASAGELGASLRLGLLTALSGGPRLLEIIGEFERRHPTCAIEVKEVALANRLESLRGGEVDLLVTRLPFTHGDVEIGPTLFSEPRVLAVAADHPLSGREQVTTEDIADFEIIDVEGLMPPELVQEFMPTSSRSGRPMKRRKLEHAEISELLTLIARGRIVHATVPSSMEHFAHPGIRSVPIADLPEWASALTWLRPTDNAAVRAFVAAAEEMLG